MITQTYRYPVGVDNYHKLLNNDYVFVDKSPTIKQVIDDGSEVLLLTRPRRFGKTLFTSMLEHFFADQVDGKPTQTLFANSLLKKQHPQVAQQHQGQYCVINITLKNVKPQDQQQALAFMYDSISQLYAKHKALLSSDQLDQQDRDLFTTILNQTASDKQYQESLLHLSLLLKKAYNKAVVVLIDEYDTPIHSAYLYDFYLTVVPFMRAFLSAGLKGNPALYKGIITGITRIAKESLFSDLNNTGVHTMLDPEYADCFGFTEQEVLQLLKQADLAARFSDIKQWYNGYQIGQQTVYNPWSIINCLQRKGTLKTYWVNTSSSNLLRAAIAKATGSAKASLEVLMQGHSIETQVDNFTHFERFEKSDAALWNLLISSGYLTTTHVDFAHVNPICHLRIPNLEITLLFDVIINNWLEDTVGIEPFHEILDMLLLGNVADFKQALQDYFHHSVSYFDTSGNNPEKFYHGFVLGMLVSLRRSHQIISNREAGLGRYDVAIIPKDTNLYNRAIIIEFKRTQDKQADLSQLAHHALQQIQQNNYATELDQPGIQHKLLLGIAFCGKSLEVATE